MTGWDDGTWAAVSGGLLVAGTGSDAGKSALVTGLCRALARRGVSVAPFKGQNMALNSAVTDSGAEIGRAQAAQAEAAGVPAEPAMNPVLLKPTGERSSQVVVGGRPWAVLDAFGYQAAKAQLRPVVRAALDDLRSRFDVVVAEGAGGAAEINLLEHDLANLGLAADAGLPAVVVGDIDRGGVFAALYGTVALLPPRLRATVGGFVINKFRGDPALLRPAVDEIGRRSGVPVLGVVPHLGDLRLDAEDSLVLGSGDAAPAAWSAHGNGPGDVLDVAVVRLPRLANATDLDALGLEPDVAVRLVGRPGALGTPDLVVLPGTKATVADLAWLRSSGMADAVTRAVRPPGGSAVLGLCGGYQLLGRRIVDRVESGAGEVDGLGWLPVVTEFRADKLTRRRRGTVAGPGAGRLAGCAVAGYEIRHGRPAPVAGGPGGPWISLEDAGGAGAEAEGWADPDAGLWATSLHGVLDDDRLRHRLLEAVAARRGKRFVPSGVSLQAAREAQFDRLADAVEAHLDGRALAGLVARARRAEAAPA